MENFKNLNLTDEQILALTKILSQTDKEKEVDWKDKLQKNEKGKILNNIENYILFLNEFPKYKEQIKYNEFLQQEEVNNKPINDFVRSIMLNDCEKETGLSTQCKFDNALNEILYNNKYNPVIDWLDSLEWDGNNRIEGLFIDLLDADDSLLNREMTKKWLIAAIKRIYEPGCKFDNMIILQGPQGIGKSSICELMSKSFFNTISLGEIGNKDLVEKLNKTWIAIIDEMDTFNKKEMSTIKTFLSLSQDSTRLAYARYNNQYKRHCIFIGSTNDDTFLRDTTSSVERRFWVIKCNKTTMDGKIRERLTNDYVDQLWAEAVHYYKENPEQYLDISKDLFDEFANTMKEFKTNNDDIAIDYIREILDKQYQLNDKGEFGDTNDFYLQFTGTEIHQWQNQNINKIPMSSLIWVLKKSFNIERSPKYVAQALSSEWEYKVIKYQSKTYKGLYRKIQKINNIEKTESELPF